MLSPLMAQVPEPHKGPLLDLIHTLLAAGLPWGKVITFVTANLPAILALFSGAGTPAAIIALVQAFIVALK